MPEHRRTLPHSDGSGGTRRSSPSLARLVAFHITSRVLQATTIITVAGEVDFSTTPRLWAALEATLRGPHTRVVVDLQELAFIDASGLNTLVRGHKRLREHGRGGLTVRNSPPAARRLFEITGIDQMLNVEPTATRSATNHRGVRPSSQYGVAQPGRDQTTRPGGPQRGPRSPEVVATPGLADEEPTR
jgi:anti-sigma B factor antagonist